MLRSTFMVGTVRLELTRHGGQQILSLLRLPVPPCAVIYSFPTVLTNKLYHKIELKSIFNSIQISNKRL